ncbi:DUF485 domain-containing protein [Arcobacter lacus]|uniref:DUF485 domain-containing membrane protein n=1 Tax=Arcobacter lacus TaxID=1912876 RepID=A0ABX5JKC8_9BACT|nr:MULTISPECIES: DUF485 domain-containing protein [Arcobacteraceae]MCT7563934.1 DUF485 domain-containing protein [Aliarcobacter butzleri]MCT7612301.1 DUF485 domain-containing protein [Aliarcobacter butzleri]MCT7641491.1 DUF485 domain-containing protein [Aliarcobacter butzleri]MCT7908267.1 DUF485 domain-containing protein [Arcobacter lacus]MCT7910755.1 DUF485 domain-containing protein [Arcobacter lacus]
MDNKLVERIKANPKYHELVSKRSSFAVKLAVFMLVIYYGFVLTIAFDKEFFATKVSADSVMTVAFPIATVIIIIAFISTLIYVVKANGEFESLTNDIKNDVKDIL